MKKIIEGSVYNTETAKKICEKFSEEPEHAKGAVVKKLQQLFKTKSGKYFFYVKKEIETWVVVNNDDLDPKFEEQEVIEEKILPISYDLAVQFASEIHSDPDLDSASKNMIGKYFPELTEKIKDENKKIQKKLYISEKANCYLEMMLEETDDTNSSFIEKLIIKEYERQYAKGIMKKDPFFEMED